MAGSVTDKGLLDEGAMDLAEAEAFSSLSRSTLHRLMRNGELKYLKVGDRRLIPRCELKRLLAARVQGGGRRGEGQPCHA
jgi:excisionase family DNA binding protein